MATVAITRGLKVDGCDLVSAFIRQSIEFQVDWLLATPGTVSVTINSVVFTPINIDITGSVYTYYLDLSDILKYIIGYPPLEVVVSGMSYPITYTCEELDHLDSDSESVVLCYAIDQIGETVRLNDVWDKGAHNILYHNGRICFYNKEAAADYVVTISGINYTYSLLNGYNIVDLHATHLISGVMTVAGTNINITLVYLGKTGSVVSWIDADGRWSFWNFRKLNEVTDSKESNDISLYYDTNAETLAKIRSNTREVSKIINFDTIAMNEDHYKQLVEIACSPIVIYDSKAWSVSSTSSSVGECRQNLNFKLSLKAEQNAVSY